MNMEQMTDDVWNEHIYLVDGRLYLFKDVLGCMIRRFTCLIRHLVLDILYDNLSSFGVPSNILKIFNVV